MPERIGVWGWYIRNPPTPTLPTGEEVPVGKV
jgi:hypothetical protein